MIDRTADSLLEEARRTVPEISADELKQRLDRGEVDLLLDVREAHEWTDGHIPGALHVPRGSLEWSADPSSDWRDERIAGKTEARIVLQCAVGGRSLLAGKTLKRMGFENVVSMAGGIEDWKAAGYPVETGAAGSTADLAS
jgi:rhodanese-related sulfurtransferase